MLQLQKSYRKYGCRKEHPNECHLIQTTQPRNSVAPDVCSRPDPGSGYRPHDDTGDEYYYGYRTIIEYDEDGRPSFSYQALTLDDFLEPEEEDVYMQGSLHTNSVRHNFCISG